MCFGIILFMASKRKKWRQIYRTFSWVIFWKHGFSLSFQGLNINSFQRLRLRSFQVVDLSSPFQPLGLSVNASLSALKLGVSFKLIGDCGLMENSRCKKSLWVEKHWEYQRQPMVTKDWKELTNKINATSLMRCHPISPHHELL